MPSDPDDNPFARASVWPKMPQAPMSIRTLPGAERAEPVPPATITPLFVRPMDAMPAAGLLSGGGVSGSAPRTPTVAPVIQPQPEPLVQVEDDTPPAVVTPAPARRAKVHRSRLPLIAAGIVGVAGLAGLALLLSRAQVAPSATIAAAPSALPPAAASVPTPAPQVTTAVPPASARDVVPATRTARPVVSRPAASSRPSAAAAPETDASLATSEALAGAVLSLPTPPPAPIYRPPVAADPAAPVVTRDPNS